MSMEEFGVEAENERGCCSSLSMRCKPSIEELITVSSCLKMMRQLLQFYAFVSVSNK